MGTDETAERLFAQKLMEIHLREDQVSVGSTRVQEIEAMFDSFLGAGYSRARKQAVLAAQERLHRFQASATRQLESGDLPAAEYVDRFNNVLSLTFKECESVLGTADFETLFGASADEMQGFIDKESFLQERTITTQQTHSRAHQALPMTVTGRSRRLAAQWQTEVTVLVVDDSDVVQAQLRRDLERDGFHVEVARNAWAALGQLSDDGRLPDLILIDVNMPVMGGFELVGWIHRNPSTCKLPVVMMTSDVTFTVQTEAAMLGTPVLSKQAGAEVLISSVRVALSR